MLQERANQRRIQLLQLHHRWSKLQPFSGKFEQQLKAVGIRVAGVRAGASMLRKMLTKKRLNVRVQLESWPPSVIKRLNGCGDVAQKIWRGFQVPVSVIDVGVAHVSRQSQHVLADALTFSGAAFRCPDGECVA